MPKVEEEGQVISGHAMITACPRTMTLTRFEFYVVYSGVKAGSSLSGSFNKVVP